LPNNRLSKDFFTKLVLSSGLCGFEDGITGACPIVSLRDSATGRAGRRGLLGSASIEM